MMHGQSSNFCVPTAAIVRPPLAVAIALVVWVLGLSGSRADDATAPACGRHLPAVTTAAVVAGRPVWKTIALGAPGGMEALRAALGERCRVGGLAAEMLDRAAAAGRPGDPADLVVLSVAELGFAGGASRAAIYQRARALGLRLCPAEVGPQLRLQYPEQPRGEFLHVAMEPVVTPRAGPAAFIVGNGGGGLLLIGSDARPERLVAPRVRFVFLRPR
jgi:hypothetical protein